MQFTLEQPLGQVVVAAEAGLFAVFLNWIAPGDPAAIAGFLAYFGVAPEADIPRVAGWKGRLRLGFSAAAFLLLGFWIGDVFLYLFKVL